MSTPTVVNICCIWRWAIKSRRTAGPDSSVTWSVGDKPLCNRTRQADPDGPCGWGGRRGHATTPPGSTPPGSHLEPATESEPRPVPPEKRSVPSRLSTPGPYRIRRYPAGVGHRQGGDSSHLPVEGQHLRFRLAGAATQPHPNGMGPAPHRPGPVPERGAGPQPLHLPDGGRELRHSPSQQPRVGRILNIGPALGLMETDRLGFLVSKPSSGGG